VVKVGNTAWLSAKRTPRAASALRVGASTGLTESARRPSATKMSRLRACAGSGQVLAASAASPVSNKPAAPCRTRTPGASAAARGARHLRRDFLQQLIEWLVELVDSVHAEGRQTLENISRLRQPLAQARLRLAVITISLECLERHGVDGARPEQCLDVLHIAVLGILGAGACPQQPLHARAARGEALKALGGKGLLIDVVGKLAAGD